MSNIVPLDAAGWEEAIDGTSAIVRGLTYQEGVSAMNNVIAFPSTNGANNVMTFQVGGKSLFEPTVADVYAQTLWETAKALGPSGLVTTSLGAAAAGLQQFGTAVFIGDTTAAGSLAGTGALMTMSLPTFVAAAAPLCGVSIGYTLYSANPELWTKISQALLPWCYDDKWTIGMVVDELCQCFVPQGAVDALNELFANEGLGNTETSTASSAVLNTLQNPQLFTLPLYFCKSITTVDNAGTRYNFSIDDGVLFAYVETYAPGTLGGRIQVTCYSTNPSATATRTQITSSGVTSVYNYSLTSISSSYSHTTYYAYHGITSGITSNYSGSYDGVINILHNYTGRYNYNDAGTIWIDGTTTVEYPEGTSAWGGTPVDLDSIPTIDILTQEPGGIGKSAYYPVTPNIGDPITSPSPLEVPYPPQHPLEWPEVVPMAVPQPAPEQWPEEWPEEVPQPEPEQEVAPLPDPLYVPQPSLNPMLNPSLDPVLFPDIVPQPQPSPDPEPNPQSTGETPPIIFPTPDVPFPSAVPASGGGLVHVYNPSASQFTSFGNWLWVTYADPSIDKLWNNPFDGVIGAHELYATPSHDGTDTIKSGFLDSGISSTVVRQRYTSINCGSMIISEYYGNYLDYSPYSKAYVYLPFIGVVEVDADDIVGHSVNILYHVDSYSGSCIAQITVAKDNYTNTIYQFSGNCAVDIPLAGGSQSAIRAALISAAAYGIGSTTQGIISGAVQGGLGGAAVGGVTNAIGSVASGIANAVSQKSTVQHSGSFGASYGAMGIKKPYIIIRRPVQKQVTNYNNDYGYPAHKRVTIGTCTGFLRVREVNVVSTLATNEEKAQIENWLKAGVYVS